jgi:hypothetical protein
LEAQGLTRRAATGRPASPANRSRQLNGVVEIAFLVIERFRSSSKESWLCSSNSVCSDLSTRGTVEDNPYGKVLGKVLEAMLGSSSDEHNIARLECISLAIVK